MSVKPNARVFHGLTCAAVLMAASPVAAEDCPGFGFESAYLDSLFCEQLRDVAGPTTRAMPTPDKVPDTGETGVEPEWLELPLVRDAWRSDPAKTLLLIQRIRDAGGRPRQ